MSTAGKVLVVLVALATIGWVVLVSMVATLNRNYGQEMDRLKGQIAKLDEEIGATRTSVYQTLDMIRHEQERKDRELTVLRTRISDLNEQEAEGQEALTRIQLQIDQVKKASVDAEADRQNRLAQKAETEKAIAEARAEVDTLKTSVDGLVARLSKLQNDFIETMKANRALLQQLKGRSAQGRTVRTASFAPGR
jgi:chromosome segregation ATPase